LKIQVIAEPSESDRICKPSPYALKYIPLSSRTDAVEHKIGQSDPVEIRLKQIQAMIRLKKDALDDTGWSLL